LHNYHFSFPTFTKILSNFDVNHDKFEVQLDVNHEALIIEVQLEGRITGRRVMVQQIRNLNDLFVS
jgi:hypothetical protein